MSCQRHVPEQALNARLGYTELCVVAILAP